MTTRRKPTLYFGVACVAGWLGVKSSTVSQWLLRYGDTPAPDAELLPGRNGIPDRGWLLNRRPEWEAWRASLPGRGVKLLNESGDQGELPGALTNDKIREIRHLYEQGVDAVEISKRYGIHKNAAYRAATRRTWRHVV